ncbi:MAG: twin-arginine translocation signal domain-containing protein [Anaerolineaceae bacterium]|nr:twin-arginine translocation signal domain-containing protein [Anaerolineaceae bacterium]
MTKQPNKNLSRRDAMKILAAAAGATVLANIPSRWSKPGLEAGVLPVHAQTSVTPEPTRPSEPHTLPADGIQIESFCYPTDMINSVTISPADAGILLNYSISTTGGTVNITAPAALNGSVMTDATGTASLTITADDITGMGTIVIVWSFANSSEGTGSSTQTIEAMGC